MPKKKQLSIKGAFKRQANQLIQDDECDELEKEIQQLRKQLINKKTELFELEKEMLKTNDFVRPLKTPSNKDPKTTVLEARLSDLERKVELQRRVLGLHVVEYDDDHFTIVYDVQRDSPEPLRYGMRINVADNETPMISKYSLPLGFNLPEVVAPFDNIKQTEALCAVWAALGAFHTRKEHYDELTKCLPYEVKSFAVPDASHVELRLDVARADEPHRVVPLGLDLEYHVREIHPYKIAIRADMSDEEEQALRAQCSVFSKRPLPLAFRDCFLQASNTWRFANHQFEEIQEDVYDPLESLRVPAERRRRARPAPPRADDYDDTWLPEDLQ